MRVNTLHKLFPKTTMSKGKILIRMYGNQTKQLMGQVSLCRERKGKFKALDFLVVDVREVKPALHVPLQSAY